MDMDELTIKQRDEAEAAADKLASIILGEDIDWPDHGAKWEEAIEEATDMRFQAQWYPVSEMLPPSGKCVLFAWVRNKGSDHTMRTGYWSEAVEQCIPSLSRKWTTQPTHWRELPVLTVV